jgi:hypothetical protein
LVPIRPRRRCERRSLRTFPGASLRPPLAFKPRPRRLSTSPDAFELHPDVRSYGQLPSDTSKARTRDASSTPPRTAGQRGTATRCGGCWTRARRRRRC